MTQEQIKRKIEMWEDKLFDAQCEAAHKFEANVTWGYGMRRVHIPTYGGRVEHCKERIEHYKSMLKLGVSQTVSYL